MDAAEPGVSVGESCLEPAFRRLGRAIQCALQDVVQRILLHAALEEKRHRDDDDQEQDQEGRSEQAAGTCHGDSPRSLLACGPE